MPVLPERLHAQSRQLKDDPLLLEIFDAHRQRFKSYCDWLGYSL